MSNICQATGKRPKWGNKISHSNMKTRVIFMPNLHKKTFRSDILNLDVEMKVCLKFIRTVVKKGGFDNCVLAMRTEKMAEPLQFVKKTILKALKKQNSLKKEKIN
jgi:large subunit ribosomal protein L28